MIGFFDPRLPFVFMAFLGVGLALRRFVSAASNLAFSTFIFPSCYHGGRGGIQTPVTWNGHVDEDYKSGQLNHSGTHPHVGVSKSGTVARQFLAVERRTTTHAERPMKESQRASCFLNSAGGLAYAPDRARNISFSCMSRLTFLSGNSSHNSKSRRLGADTALYYLDDLSLLQAPHGCISGNALVLRVEGIARGFKHLYHVIKRECAGL